MLAQTLIEDAMSTIRVKKKGFAPDNDDVQLMLRQLQRMLAHWFGTMNLMIPYRTRETLALSSGINSVTIGPSGTLNTVRPTNIEVAKLALGTSEYALRIEDLDSWSWNPDRSSGGRPTKLYYEPVFPLGIMYFDRTTDQAYDLILNSFKPMTNFSDLTTDVDFPPEYEELIVANLSVRDAPAYGKSAGEDTKILAERTLIEVRGNNQALRVPIIEVDPGLLGYGAFNFQSGEFS